MKTFLTKEQMQKLNTKRLLAYKDKLMKYPEGPSWDENNVDRMNKSKAEWKKAHANIKEVLAGREHVKRKSKP
jgi:hypothetical protein